MNSVLDRVSHTAGKLILRFDDISPGMAWEKFLPAKEIISQFGIRSVLGVVPECRDPKLSIEPERLDFFTLVRGWLDFGDTIAQHGTYHLYDSSHSGMLGLQNRSEFAGHPYVVQYERLAFGKEILCGKGVWEPFFMAPSHSFDHNTLLALRDLGFMAITDGFGFYPYRVNGIVLVPQLTARPLNIKFGVQTLCVHINGMSGASVTALLSFIEKNRTRFIDFREAISQDPPGELISALLRLGSSMSVKAARGVRSAFFENDCK